MLGLSVTTRILLFTGATDMRKGFDGLSSLVTAAGEDPYSGHLYVFVSRRRDRAKILAFQKGGMVLWHKRLDCGRFQIHLPDAGARAELDATQLAMLVDGIDFGRATRHPHGATDRQDHGARLGARRPARLMPQAKRGVDPGGSGRSRRSARLSTPSACGAGEGAWAL